MARRFVPEIDWLRAGLLLAAVLIALWLGVPATRPPAVVPASAPATAFSAERAMRDVAAIGVAPHPTGSAENVFVAHHLAGRLRELGLHAEERHYMTDDETLGHLARWSGGALVPSELIDVIGILPGRDHAKPAVLLMAHFDTVWASPGAADDSAGVASILEIVRACRARGTPERDVIVLFTDGEEVGYAGSRAFWGGDPLAHHAGAVINMDVRGAGGRALMFETGPDNGPMMRLYRQVVQAPVANSLAVFVYRLIPNGTDFTIARGAGETGFNFAFSGRPQYYHSPRATVDVLDPRSVQDMGGQALDIAGALAFTATLPGRGADATFFDLFGHRLILYGTAAGWLIVLAAAAALAGAWWRARPSPGAIAAGAGIGLWTMATGSLLLLGLNLLSGSEKAPNYYDRLAAIARLERLDMLACVALLIAGFSLVGARIRVMGIVPPLVLALLDRALGGGGMAVWLPAILAMVIGFAMPRDGAGAWGGWIGLAALLLLFALVAQVAAPTAAWLLAWPALIVTVSLAGAAAIGRTRPALILAAAGAALATALLIPLVHLAFLFLGSDTPQMLLIAAPVLLAAFWPLARMRPTPAGRATIALCLVIATVMAWHVRTDPIADTVPPYSLATGH